MSTYLVTKEEVDYAGITRIVRLNDIPNEGVDVLIFHSCTEEDDSSDDSVDTILTLSSFKKRGIEKFIYINKVLNPLYYGIFTALGGDIYNDDSYLHDEEVLNFLISDYKETGMAVKPAVTDVEALSKSIELLEKASGDKEGVTELITNRYWISTLASAVTNIENSVNMSLTINEQVTTVLAETQSMINDIMQKQDITATELEKIHEEFEKLKTVLDKERKDRLITPVVETVEDYSLDVFDTPLKFFPTYPLPSKVDKVLYIRSYTPCPYLLSTISSYAKNYSQNFMSKVSVLYVLPKLYQVQKKYQDFKGVLSPDALSITDFFGGNDQARTLATFDPTKDVLDAFFTKQGNVSLFIVIDCLYAQRPLLKSSRVGQMQLVHAGGSYKDIQTALDTKRVNTKEVTIVSGGMIVVPPTNKEPQRTIAYGLSFNTYYAQANTRVEKESHHFKANEKLYKALDAQLGR